MNFGQKRPKVIVFFKDAVPSEAELAALANAPQYIQLMPRNAAAILPGDKPEACDYVIGNPIPEPYANIPVFDGKAEREIKSDQREAAKDHVAEAERLRKEGEANGITLPPARDDNRPLAYPSDPDIKALHGELVVGKPTEKLGGFPSAVDEPHEPGTVTTREPDASNPGTAGLPAAGAPATPAPAPAVGGKSAPAKGAEAPAAAWGNPAPAKS